VGHLQKAADFVHAYILGARRRLGGRAAGAACSLAGLSLRALPPLAVGCGLARGVGLAEEAGQCSQRGDARVATGAAAGRPESAAGGESGGR